jgi:hypothetical protein
MQLVARKFCLAQPNDCYISLPTAHAVHRAQQYLLVHSSSQALALPTPRRFQVRRSGWGRPGSGQVRGPPPPRRTCAAGREVGALTSASPLCLRHQRRCRRRCCCCQAEAVAEAAVAVHWRLLDALTKFEFSNLYSSTCSLHVQDVLIVLKQQGL